MTLADANAITMPEYLALSHHWRKSNEDEKPAPPSPDEVMRKMLALERAGIARIN